MSRIKRLRQVFTQNNIDALLVSNFYNILYLTGFKTLTCNEREAYVLVTNKSVYLFTDGRYLNKNSKLLRVDYQVKVKLITPDKGISIHLKEIIDNEKINLLGIEAEDLKVSEYHKLQKVLPDLKIIPTEKLIIKLREIKERGETQKINKACQIADSCLRDITKTIKIGLSEKELAFKIELSLKEKGYDLAFEPIVAIDKNSSLPHYDTSDGRGKIKNNSIILIDFGAKYQDYNSDITRMIFINPTQEILNIYNVLLSIQEKTVGIISSRSYQSGKKIDQFCRELIINNRLPNYPHSTGHGVGLEIHEYPKISQKSTDIICPGQVFTIEPGVYFEGKWGMRIEDVVVISDNRQAEVLTKFTKKPLIINL